MIDLCHLDGAFNLIDLKITPVQLSAHLPHGSLVAIDELLSLVMLLLRGGAAVQGLHLVVGIELVYEGGQRRLTRMESVGLWQSCRELTVLGKGDSVHILEELVLLDELVLEHLQLRIDLPILILQAIDLNLRVHILLVKVLSRLQRHLRYLVLHLARDLLRGAKDPTDCNSMHLARGQRFARNRHAESAG